MTIKKLWKRICCLFHDDRTRLREGETLEDWEEVQRKRRELEAEKQRKEDDPPGAATAALSAVLLERKRRCWRNIFSAFCGKLNIPASC